VFADLEHTGKLSGPQPTDAKPPRGFVITVPLSAKDAAGEALPEPANGGEDVALRLGRLRVAVKEGGDVALAVNGENVAAVRLYQRIEKGWRHVAPNKEQSWTLKADKAGVVEVGVGVVLPEATAGAADPGWPGAFTVEVGTAGDATGRVRVPVRTAPFLIPSPLDPVETLLIVSDTNTAAAVKGLEAFAATAELKLSVHHSKPAGDAWMQDTIEPGVFAYPAGDKVGQASAALTGLRKEFGPWAARLDREVAARLRDDGVVAVAAGVPRKNSRWIDWYGNLEVTPPHTDGTGRRFPYGRILTGRQRDLDLHPGVTRFLKAQGAQWPPVVIDTSWLFIGHVDEVVNFVPAKTKTGYEVLLPSPKAARDLLDALIAKGHADLPVFEKTRTPTTVRQLRELVAGSKENLAVDEAVGGIRQQLRKELGLTDADFVLLPALFKQGMAVIPNAVNSVVVNGHLLATAPAGPRHDDKDLFEEAIRQSLADCDVRVTFVDAWSAYHVRGGEFHCGTNAVRRLRDPAWWKHVEPSGPEK
jgi:protein-arginine deiminase